jgi:hypothetical protein
MQGIVGRRASSAGASLAEQARRAASRAEARAGQSRWAGGVGGGLVDGAGSARHEQGEQGGVGGGLFGGAGSASRAESASGHCRRSGLGAGARRASSASRVGRAPT